MGVLRDLYMFWIFVKQVITVLSFIIVGYVWQILGRRGDIFAPQSVSSPEKTQPEYD